MFIPTILENNNGFKVSYDIYSRLLKSRIIILTGEIDDNISSLIVSELLYLDSINHEDIHLYINSPGGSVSAGLAIYDTMEFIKSDVCTYALGLAASMGAFILSGGKNGKRYILKNSEVMIHEVSSQASGKSTEIISSTEHIKKVNNRINKLLAKNTNKTIKQIEASVKIDNYMDAFEAVKFGIVDKVL